jgi:hypothetical protein
MQAAVRIRKSGRRLLGACGVAIVGLAFGVAGPAGAAKPGSGSSASSGSCVVNPSPVALGANWTLTGSNLGANALVNVLITDAAGSVTSWNLQADGTGATSVTWHSYASGTSSVRFMKSGRHGGTVAAACSFVVS